MLGAMTIHGIQSGPLFISQNPALAYGMFAAYILAHPLMLAICSAFMPVMIRIASVRLAVLAPVVLVLCVVGAYALNNTMQSVYVLLIFGVLGYIDGEVRLPLAPLHPGRDPRRPDRDQPGPRHHDRRQSLAVPDAADLGRVADRRPLSRSRSPSGSTSATRSAPPAKEDADF